MLVQRGIDETHGTFPYSRALFVDERKDGAKYWGREACVIEHSLAIADETNFRELDQTFDLLVPNKVSRVRLRYTKRNAPLAETSGYPRPARL